MTASKKASFLDQQIQDFPSKALSFRMNAPCAAVSALALSGI
jgi:hypothetical protein